MHVLSSSTFFYHCNSNFLFLKQLCHISQNRLYLINFNSLYHRAIMQAFISEATTFTFNCCPFRYLFLFIIFSFFLPISFLFPFLCLLLLCCGCFYLVLSQLPFTLRVVPHGWVSWTSARKACAQDASWSLFQGLLLFFICLLGLSRAGVNLYRGLSNLRLLLLIIFSFHLFIRGIPKLCARDSQEVSDWSVVCNNLNFLTGRKHKMKIFRVYTNVSWLPPLSVKGFNGQLHVVSDLRSCANKLTTNKKRGIPIHRHIFF